MWKKKRAEGETQYTHYFFFFTFIFAPSSSSSSQYSSPPRPRRAAPRFQASWLNNQYEEKLILFPAYSACVCVCVYHRPGLRGTVAQTFGPYNDRVHHHHCRRYHAAVRCSILFFFFLYYYCTRSAEGCCGGGVRGHFVRGTRSVVVVAVVPFRIRACRQLVRTRESYSLLRHPRVIIIYNKRRR